MKKQKLLQTVLGLVMCGAGLWIAFNVAGRGDMLVIFFIGFGGFLVSQTVVAEFFKTVWSSVRGK